MATKKKASSPVYKVLPIGDISTGANQRQFFDGIPELAARINDSKWVSPIVVTSEGVIVAGERRYRACQLLKLEAIPCEIFDGTEEELLDRNTSENLGRRDFRFIELCRIFKSQRDKGRTLEQVATKTGYSSDTISRYVSVLTKCHPDIIKRLDNGDVISIDILYKLSQIKSHEVQLLRLKQWLEEPTNQSEPGPAKQRTAPLRRKRMVQLLKVLQESGATDETIQVAQFMAGMRQTLPHKWHLKLSQRRQMPAPASEEF